MAENSKGSENDTLSSQTRWRRIYASVIGFTIVVVLLLYAFSQYYSG